MTMLRCFTDAQVEEGRMREEDMGEVGAEG